MDIEKAISEAAAKHRLKQNDPAFLGVILNSVVLREYANELERRITESITNVAIKEDVTLVKLRNLLDEKQINNRKEIERILNQFADNLQARIQLVSTSSTSSKPSAWPAWLVSAFLSGMLMGLLAGAFL